MNIFQKFLFIRWFVTLFVPLLATSQLYDNPNYLEITNHFFVLDYFPTSWQSSVFEYDYFASKSKKQKTEFNILSNALRLNYSGAEKMLNRFKEDFPNEIESNLIDLDLANYYFKNEKYGYALKWFNRVSENTVPDIEKAKFNFNKGYSLFFARNYKKAKPYLEKVKDNKNYDSDAHYYLGHISYQLEDFDSALSSFRNISNSLLKENLNYFQSDMNFRLGRFNQAIKLAKNALKTSNEIERSELSKIIGESYFNLELYAKSIPYLNAYNGKEGKWRNNDFYQLGYAYFKEKEFEKAINQFNKIVGSKNALTQNTYYSLAECYLKINQKTSALNAFRSASKMDFDQTIKEDSFLNYVKLSYEIGNPYEDTPRVLLAFLEKYPRNNQSKLIRELLINSYTKSNNYRAALEILENKSGFKNNKTLQKVLILNAIQEFKSGHFSEASLLLKRALKFNESKLLEAYSLYWYARSEYELNLYENSLDIFKQFRKHPKKNEFKKLNRLNYDIGYVYFKLREFKYALDAFQNFNKNNSALDISYQRDTYLRMADCQFALKNYWPAIDYYNVSIALNPQLGAYATFQKAISFGFLDRNKKKIEILTNFYNTYTKDKILDDVLFELALTYTAEKSDDLAIKTYDKLLNSFKNSPYLARSLLNKGLILYNNDDYDSAKNILEEIALTYRNYSVGEQAIRTLREISVDKGEVVEFKLWINKNKLNSFTDVELEKSVFNSAERQFLQGNKKLALKLLKQYLNSYSDGAFSKVASYYLAELYYEMGQFEDALKAYKVLTKDKISNYKEKSLTRIITILKNNNQLLQAIPFMEDLSNISSIEENRRFAIFNLMQAYYKNLEFEKTYNIAEKVLNLSDLDDNIRWDALILKARSSIALKDTLNAALTYEILENAPQIMISAEAMYFRAHKLHLEKNYSESNNLIIRISENTGLLGIWNAKALLLLAKNYYELNDSFQAIFVLESLIESFESYPEIIELAKKLKSKFQNNLSQENSSINK